MTDQTTVDSINRLVRHPAKPRERLAPAPSADALPGRGQASPDATAADTGAGIASPLTELPAKTIEIIKTITITGGDGEVDIGQMTDVTFLDAKGRAVRFILKPSERPLPVPPPAP